MNQKQLNQIAVSFINKESEKVADKLKETLKKDASECKLPVSKEGMHHIHTQAIFNLLRIIIIICYGNKDASEQEVKEYLRYAESLRPEYMNIVEALKDFILQEN